MRDETGTKVPTTRMTEPITPATLRALAAEVENGFHVVAGCDCLECRAATALREAAAALEEAQKSQRLVSDLLEERADDLTKEACDNCEYCSKHVMCNFHSVLSALEGRTWTVPALERDELRRRAEAAEALCATLRSQLQEEQEKNLARVDGHS